MTVMLVRGVITNFVNPPAPACSSITPLQVLLENLCKGKTSPLLKLKVYCAVLEICIAEFREKFAE